MTYSSPAVDAEAIAAYVASDVENSLKFGAAMDSFSDSGCYPPPDMGHSFKSTSLVIPKDVGIGAGASIEQSFVEDRRELSTWDEEPGAVIRLYFVFQDEFDSYAAHGLKDLSGTPEGYLKDLPMGGSDE